MSITWVLLMCGAIGAMIVLFAALCYMLGSISDDQLWLTASSIMEIIGRWALMIAAVGLNLLLLITCVLILTEALPVNV